MADLVLGVAKSLVEGTLTRALSAIDEESGLRKSSKRDLVFIAGEFQMMQSFLSDTTEEAVKESVVNTWVTQVRDLAYDVEDGIEFIVHLDNKCTDWMKRMIPSCLRKELPLDMAVDIIVQLKARVQDVSQRNDRYKRIGDHGQKPVTEVAQMVSIGASEMLAKERDTACWRHDLEALTKLITKGGGDELQVISVWISEDAPGARPIVRKACDNPEIWGNFTYHACVKLTHHFNPHKFFRGVLDQFEQQGAILGVQTRKPAPQARDYLIKEFKQQLKDQTYLIVLEDMPNMEVWNVIREYLPTSGKRSRIVLSTHHFEVACSCTRPPCFQRFSADQSLCVFFKEGTNGASATDQSDVLIGRVSETKQLSEYLGKMRTGGFNVISVWGIAGAGKTSLVRELYIKEHQSESKRFDKYAWVDVSHPFNLRDFCQSLLLQFHSHSAAANGSVHGGKTVIRYPVQECHDILKKHRCLVVVDNLKSKEDWDSIQGDLAFRPSQSGIIVVTNEESIAMHCADREDLVFNVKALEAREALNLFRKEVVKANEDFPVDNIDTDVKLRELISMCGGLPKVIVATAGCFADDFDWVPKMNLLSANFIKNLETRPAFSGLRDLMGCIHSYFHSCPNSMKPCIFYLSIFPKSLVIRRRRLVMRWVAEGYSKDSDRVIAEENGEEIFTKITELSMIQPPESTSTTTMRMVWCQVSAFFHEYIMSRPKEENVTFALEVFALKERCSQTTGRTGRHLVIEKDWKRDENVFESIDFSRLRSLTVFGKWESFFFSKSMKVLRVLDLENASGVTDKDLQKMMKSLTRLKYLSLRGCSEINCLPCSVGELRQLQTLDVRDTKIVTIPASISKLRRLQYIRAGTIILPEDPSKFKLSDLCRCCERPGVKVASRVGDLTKLHTLGVVNAGVARGKCILKKLKNLTQLRKLGVSGISKKNSKEFCLAVSCYYHLKSLSVWLDKNNQNCLDDILVTEPPINLQSLKLYGSVGRLPSSIDKNNMPLRIDHVLKNLRKINLEMGTLSKEDIEVLGNLKELRVLRLRIMERKPVTLNFCVQVNGVAKNCYENVKVLEIGSRSSLFVSFDSWKLKSAAMQNLELVKVECYGTGALPQFTGLCHLRELKDMHLFFPHNDELKEHLKGQIAKATTRSLLKMYQVNPAGKESTSGSDQRCLFPFFHATTTSPGLP